MSLTQEQKVQIARQLDKLGVNIIEAGFPVSSKGEFESVRQIAKAGLEAKVCGLSRIVKKDAQACIDAEVDIVHVFVPTSDIQIAHTIKMSHDEIVAGAAETVQFVKDSGKTCLFSAMDATRTSPQFLHRIFRAVEEVHCDIINIPDTVGVAVLSSFYRFVKDICDDVNMVVDVHCHNDFGLAVANSLAAASAGARQIECTINGIGERAGNAALEEIVAAMQVRRDRLPFATGIDATQLYAASCLVAEVVGFGVQPNKAIVGRNAFAHEAGIHQHGVLKNPLCYEILTPESVGVPSNAIVLGKHSGRHALALRYAELGYTVASTDLDRIYHRFTALADRKKRIFDQDLISLIAADRDGSSRALVGIRA